MELTFTMGASGKPSGLRTVGPDGDTTSYQPVTVGPLAEGEARGYAGSYYSDELEARYTVTARNGGLALRMGDEPESEYPRFGADVFAAGQTVLRFTRTRAGTIDGLVVSAGRVKNLRFVRK
jgi:hypothetical protein